MKILKLLFEICRFIGLPAWFVVTIYNAIDQLTTWQMEQALRGTEGATIFLFLYGAISFLNAWLAPTILVLLTFYGLKRAQGLLPHWTEFWSENFQSLLKETLRSWGKSLQWGLFFVLPGLYRFLSLILVPFVVVFSPSYQRGEKDAVQYSTALFKKKWGLILLVFLVFHIILPLALSGSGDDRTLWSSPLLALLFSFLDTLIGITGILMLYFVFKSLLPEEISLSPSGQQSFVEKEVL